MSLLAVTSGDIASGVVEAEGVDFDGVSDYLSRSTDLVGNVDSKTFTFSCWVYPSQSSIQYIYDSGTYFQISINASNQLVILAKNASNTTILNATVTVYLNPLFTFHNVLISIDLSNISNRYIYVNDLLCTVTWTTYTNDTINFTNLTHGIAALSNGSSKLKGRLSNIFLDYVYRDLSIEANRRLFITSDGKPAAGWKSLNPIIGMPIKDSATAHLNTYGTGGNFTLNGTIATSNRGANQDNCVASYFDGTADYLSRTSLTGVADGKQFTFSCNYVMKSGGASDKQLFSIARSDTSGYFTFAIMTADNRLYILGFNGYAGTVVLNISIPTNSFVQSRMYNFSFSIDLSSSLKRKIFLDGVDKTSSFTFTTYSNVAIDFLPAGTPSYVIGGQNSTIVEGLFNGNIGELYFDTKYIDLATNNPFWDSIENKPVPVRKVIADTGVTPLIAMPLDASNAGKNYGSGGDFVANSSPYIGSRGASEFWCRSVLVDGSNYLTYSGGLLCASLVKWVSTNSGVTWNVSYLNNVTVTNIGGGTDNGRVAYYFGTSEVINWALEVNKLRFTDGLGYPIEPIIDSNTLLYLPFDNSSNLGYNMGSGNDLTIVGSVVQSSDVKG